MTERTKITPFVLTSGRRYSIEFLRSGAAVGKRLRWSIIISDDKQWACRPLVATCA